MKRQIINSTNHLMLDASKVVLLKIQPQKLENKQERFSLIACLDSAGSYQIGEFSDKEDAIEVFNGLSSYLWNRTETNIYFIKNESCIKKALAKLNMEEVA